MTLPSTSLYPSESLLPEGSSLLEDEITDAVTPSARVLAEVQPDVAGLYLDEANGQLTSAHPLASDASVAMVDYSFTSERLGGFATLDATTLPRARGRHPFRKFMPARLVSDAGESLWAGRLDNPGEVSPEGQLQLQCVGHAVLLAETEMVFLGVANDLTVWGDPPAARIEGANNAGQSVNQSFQTSAGEEGLQITMDSDRGVENSSRGEIWWGKYGELMVAKAQYIASDVSPSEMDPEIQAYDAPGGATIDTQNLDVTLAKTTFTPTTPSRYISIRDKPDDPSPPLTKVARSVTVHAISLFGDHELATYKIENLPDGLRFSDVLELLVGNAGIAVTRSGVSTVHPSRDVSDNLAWLESTSLRAILDEAVELEPTYSWGVWEGPTFHWQPMHQGAVWEARREDGATFEVEGETAEEDYNVAVVVYENRDGRIKRVGPPGWGGDQEEADLVDDDPTLELNQFGLTKPLVVEAGRVSDERALELGVLALREAKRKRWQGTVGLPRLALRNGIPTPTFLLRADDVIRDAGSGELLPVATATYTRSNPLPVAATIDTPANRLDAALAELEARPRRLNKKRIRKRYRKQRHRRRKEASK
jgi:hypothetical protein